MNSDNLNNSLDSTSNSLSDSNPKPLNMNEQYQQMIDQLQHNNQMLYNAYQQNAASYGIPPPTSFEGIPGFGYDLGYKHGNSDGYDKSDGNGYTPQYLNSISNSHIQPPYHISSIPQSHPLPTQTYHIPVHILNEIQEYQNQQSSSSRQLHPSIKTTTPSNIRYNPYRRPNNNHHNPHSFEPNHFSKKGLFINPNPSPVSKKISIPLDLQFQIFDIFSSASFNNLKILTRISKDTYDRYSKILYKRLHIQSYAVTTRMVMILFHHKQGNDFTTSENKKLFENFTKRRTKILRICTCIRFTSYLTVEATKLVVTDLKSSIYSFISVTHVIIDGLPHNLGEARYTTDLWEEITSSRIWGMIKPEHIRIDTYGTDLYRSEDPLEFLLQGENLKSVSWHDFDDSSVVSNKIPLQRFYYSNDRSEENYKGIRIMHEYYEPPVEDSQPSGKIELQNVSTPPEYFRTWPSHRNLPVKDIEVFSPADTEPCVCCGLRC